MARPSEKNIDDVVKTLSTINVQLKKALKEIDGALESSGEFVGPLVDTARTLTREISKRVEKVGDTFGVDN